MKYYNITVNGVAYSVSVEETAAGAAPVAAPAAPAAPKAPAAPAAAPKAAAPAGAAVVDEEDFIFIAIGVHHAPDPRQKLRK